MKKILLFILMWLVMSGSELFADMPSHPLLEQAKKARAPRVKYALDNGAQIGLTPEGKSFYLLWYPEGTNPGEPLPMVVTMHGHDGWAFDDFNVWHTHLKERGYGFLAIQWWLGKGESINDYLLPNEIYRTIDDVLRRENVKPGTALLHGFSRGSANIYPVAVMDRSLQNNYFALFIANAGKANSGYPPIDEIDSGRFGARPLEGSHWVTFAGGKDTEPDRDGIPGMREAGEWIKRHGGTVDLAIEDPEGDHGGFHRRPQNCRAALDVFDTTRVHKKAKL